MRNAQRVTLTCGSARDVRAALGSRDVVAGIWVPSTPFLHVSFSNCWPSSLLRKQTWACYIALPNKWADQKSANFKIQKILQSQKGLLSRGATGWMLHFNVRNTNCLLNNMSFGIGLEKVGHIFQGNIYRSVDIMWPAFSSPLPKDTLLRRQTVLRTLKWTIQPVALRLKSPLFESARFLYLLIHCSYNDFVHFRKGACVHYVMISKIQWKPFWEELDKLKCLEAKCRKKS